MPSACHLPSTRHLLSEQNPGPQPGIPLFLVVLSNYLGFLMFACAAARRAIGTRNGEQLT